jgi:hypothetical protein
LGSKTYIEQLIEVADVPLLLRRIATGGSVVLLIGIAFFILLQSPLGPGSVTYPDTDSSLFIYTASQILDGNLPYRDIFDYHSPLIYLIDALGMLFLGSIGIWIAEVLFLAGTLVVLFFALNRNVGPVPSFLTCLIIAALIAYSLQGGNRIEEYALLFQAIALAGFLDVFRRHELSHAGVYFIGLSAALTFCLDPALVIFWVPYVAVIVVLLLKHGGIGVAFTRTFAIILGASIAFILLIPWLYFNNALTSYYDQVFVFARELLALVTPQQQQLALQTFATRLPFILTVVLSLFIAVKLLVAKRATRTTAKKNDAEKSDTPSPALSPASEAPPEPPSETATGAFFGGNTVTLIFANLVATLAVYGVMALKGSTSEHIILPGLICLAIPLAYAFQLFVLGFKKRAYLQIAVGGVFALALAAVVIIPGFGATIALADTQRLEPPELLEQEDLVAALRANQTDDEPIIVFGDGCWVYTAIDSYSATRYAYQPFSASFRADLNNDFYRQVNVARAQLIVDSSAEGLAARYPGIDDYEQIYAHGTYKIYQRIE